MSPILIVLAVLAGLWIAASILAVSLCKIASRGNSLASMALRERSRGPRESRPRGPGRLRPTYYA